MARLASAADFKNGPLYDDYDASELSGVFLQRAQLLRARFPTGNMLIAGCGPGYTVRHLLDLGVDVWGIDASAWAIAVYAREVLPSIARARLRLGSVLARNDMNSIGKQFSTIVTEDLLPVLTDIEVATALTELRRIGTTLFHIITPGNPADPNKLEGLNWKSILQWKALVGGDAVFDVEKGVIV